MLYAFDLPAVKVNARQLCQRNGSAPHAHTLLHSKRRCSAIRDQRESGQSERQRRGREREREKKRHHRRGSVRVQKQTGIEEEGSISRPLFSILFLFFLSFTRQSPHCDWMSRRLPWRQLGATMPAAAAAAEVPGQAATRQRRH